MARDGASPDGALSPASLVVRAIEETAARRAGVDRPGLYPEGDDPWTDQIARALRDGLSEALERFPTPDAVHEIAARWRFPAMMEAGAVRAGADPVYDIAWRVYSTDLGQMKDQPFVAECCWRGGWRALSAAADRLAQARAGLKLLCAEDDPARDLGGMNLAEACAFRLAAFAPPGDRLLLAFYRPEPGAGGRFELLRFEAGDHRLHAVNP
ncbi:MAG: hypothetical protein ABL308_03395 [Oceanicaulis sp.]